MVMPITTVLPPPFTPARYGLQSVVIPRADGRAELGGVDWQSETCGVPRNTYWVDVTCATDPPTTNVDVAITWAAVDGSTARVSAGVSSPDGRRSANVAIQGFPQFQGWTDQGATQVAVVPRGTALTYTVTDPYSGITNTASYTIPGAGASGTLGTLNLADVPMVKDDTGGGTPERGRGEPFTVFHSLACGERDLADARSRLEREFAARESYLVENALWSGVSQGGTIRNTPVLSGTDQTTFPVRATGIVAAVARLEEAFYWQNLVQGIIHAPRWVYAHAAAANLIVRDRNTLRTPADTLWSFGTGYDSYTGPTGTGETAADGESWLYMTGPISQWRTDTSIIPSGNGVGRSGNSVEMLAERTYVLAYDCDAIATLAAFPFGGGGGGGGF